MVLANQCKLACVMGTLTTAIVIAGIASGASAQDSGDARAILKAMSDYVSSRSSISATFNTDIEVITSDLQKIQFDSSGQLQLSRPDKVHANRTGSYTDIEMFFDGKTFVVENKKDKVFAQTESPGSIDQLIDKLRSQLGVDLPGADLLGDVPPDVEKREAGVAGMKATQPSRCEQDVRSRGRLSPCAWQERP
jgi:hypothetical protein